MANSSSEQIDTLRRMGKPRLIIGMKVTCLVIGCGLFITGILTKTPIYFVFVGFVALVAWSVWQSSPHIHNAVLAINSRRHEKGIVFITIEKWSDSSTYHARVTDTQSLNWNFEFIPHGWEPDGGQFEAELYFLTGVPWPALVITEVGILFPRDTPKSSHDRPNP